MNAKLWRYINALGPKYFVLQPQYDLFYPNYVKMVQSLENDDFKGAEISLQQIALHLADSDEKRQIMHFIRPKQNRSTSAALFCLFELLLTLGLLLKQLEEYV